MLTVYTAQYRYSGLDRLDITVKGQDPFGRVFAPTWDMVSGVKNGTLFETIAEAVAFQKEKNLKQTPPSYEAMYYTLMQKSRRENEFYWQRLWDMTQVTLVCFCPTGAFCHRVVLAEMLQRMGATYAGERPL